MNKYKEDRTALKNETRCIRKTGLSNCVKEQTLPVMQGPIQQHTHQKNWVMKINEITHEKMKEGKQNWKTEEVHGVT